MILPTLSACSPNRPVPRLSISGNNTLQYNFHCKINISTKWHIIKIICHFVYNKYFLINFNLIYIQYTLSVCDYNSFDKNKCDFLNSKNPMHMSKFLFVVPPFFGHINATLSLGASLLQKGHDVKWLGIQPLAVHHIPPGGEFICPEKDLAAYHQQIQGILARQGDENAYSGPEVMKFTFEETFIPFARIMMPVLDKFVDTWKPDVIIGDYMAFAGSLCAYLREIPCVISYPVPPDLVSGMEENVPKVFTWHEELMKGLQQEFGVSGDVVINNLKQMDLVFTSAEFSGIAAPPPHMKFVGPVKGRPNPVAFSWDLLEKAASPKVFVSLGTVLSGVRESFFKKLVEAFADMPLTVIAVTDPALFEQWPDNFIVSRVVPQLELLPKMDVVISHGGFNTINETLMNGLPMLVTPIAYDQFHNAKLVENAGCGIVLRYKRLRAEDMRNAVLSLLNDPKYKESSARIRDSFTDGGGNDRAVQLLEEFVARRSPLIS
ncbi:glycosyltransferase, MGT family [Pedobacter hartonius]|uniref:Glycosyltransferase, MGT family n=2 Tax=Pedobacter hartonius TaxID=425514 RepID=A0A1H4GZQ9_9SPHI|nr:glycosyltransferase, MGT family [Pedobacter hartonius]